MVTEFIKLDNTILYVIKKMIHQHQQADIELIFDEVTKTIDFQHITKDSLNDRVNQLLQSNRLINKINRNKDSFFLNEDTIDMSIIDMIPYIQNSPPSKVLDTSENILNSFETTPSLSTQMNLIETPKKANEASIHSHEIEQSEFLGDKIFEKVKLDRLMTIILKSIIKYIEDLIRNELLTNKYTLPEKLSDEIYKKEINMLREELKSKDLLQTIKEMETKSVSVQSNTSPMSSSKVNLLPANNSVAIEDVCNNNDEIVHTNDEIIIPDKKDINDNLFKKSMQNQLEEVIREKKEKFYELKNSDNKNSEPVATNNKRETQGKYPDGTAIIIGDSILNGIIQERLSRKGRVVKVHNFRGATVDDMKPHVILLLFKEPSFIIIHAGTNDAPYLI